MTTSVVAVRHGAKDLTQLGEEQRTRTGKKPGKSAPVGRELSSKERERTRRTQQVPLEGTSVIKTRSQHLQEYLHLAADSSKPLLGVWDTREQQTT